MILDLQESENSNFESNENQIYHNNMLENNSILKIINELNEIYENSIININLRKEDRKKIYKALQSVKECYLELKKKKMTQKKLTDYIKKILNKYY